MPACPVCGNAVIADEACAYHLVDNQDEWASGNKAFCDFAHRGLLNNAASITFPLPEDPLEHIIRFE